MADYRFYFHDGRGHFISAVDFSCDDDDVATEEAEVRRDGAAGELWQQARRVREFAADRPSCGRASAEPLRAGSGTPAPGATGPA